MDREQFDTLVRLFAAKGSRRKALGAFVSAALLGQSPDALAAPGKGKGKGRDHGKGRGEGHRKGKGRGHDQGQGLGHDKYDATEDVPSSADEAGDAAGASDVPAEPGEQGEALGHGESQGQGHQGGKPGQRNGHKKHGDGVQAENRGRRRRKGNKSREQSPKQDPEAISAEASNCCGTKSCAFPSLKSERSYCNFAGADLSGINGTLSNLQYVDGRKTTFSTQAKKGIWYQANFSYACLGGAKLNYADLRKANFAYACLIDADLSNAQSDSSTNYFNAILCRTKMKDGSVSNRDCTRATSCCPFCDDEHRCLSGQVCCNGKCKTGTCCTANDCETKTCQNKACTGNKCVYTPISGTTGPNCDTLCCSGVCCEAGETCNANGQCGCDTTNDCGQGQICCDGACHNGDCCTAQDCGTSGNICDNFQCECGTGPECSGSTPFCCGEGQAATCQECCNGGQCNDNETCLNGECCADANVCGEVCLDAPCNANQCLVCNEQQGACVTTCTNPALPNCCNGTCRECCDNNQCAPSETCLNFACCATANVCGNVCLDAPCDTSECQQCNPNTGACVSTCTADETCCGGDCVPTASLCGSICGNVCEAPTPNCCGTECEECCNNSQCNEAGCEICSGNQCVSKCSGETPDCNGSGTCICNAVSCVGGCCNTTTGACVDYDDQTDTICGASGNCAACDTANCFHCNASDGTCDFGCSGSTPVCNGSGVCVECTQNSDCNENLCEICSGNQCVSKCSGETPDCSGSGTCICNATSCVGGCCSSTSGACVDYADQTDGICGEDGDCAPCDTANCFHCDTADGTCDLACTAGQTCCSGLCVTTSALCGGVCGNVCTVGQICCGSECVTGICCSVDASCIPGTTTCCNGQTCVEDTETGEDSCQYLCEEPGGKEQCEDQFGTGVVTCDSSAAICGPGDSKCCRPKAPCGPGGSCTENNFQGPCCSNIFCCMDAQTCVNGKCV